jgi:hypothetical protein
MELPAVVKVKTVNTYSDKCRSNFLQLFGLTLLINCIILALKE